MEEKTQEMLEADMEWEKLLSIVESLTDALHKSNATSSQVLLASLMITNTVLNNDVKEETLNDKNDLMSKLRELSEKILSKSGITRK